MKASFQILTQPWIPVKELDGSMKELSLLETLERAHLLSEIQDPSPMVEYSVYRFLIVFLMDMLRPEDEEVLEELLDEGQFDWDTIQRYVRQCEQEGVSFDLFDSERPFLQTRYRADWDRDPKPVIIFPFLPLIHSIRLTTYLKTTEKQFLLFRNKATNRLFHTFQGFYHVNLL